MTEYDSRARPLAHPTLPRRLAAMIYDTLLVIALIAVVNAIALGMVVKLSAGQQEVLPPLLVQSLTALSFVVFYTVFWIKSGQTLGMQAWRIKLVNFDGSTPTVARSVLRCFGATASLACLGLGFLWCLFDRNDRYWHDYISGTELVLLPKREKADKG